ncbi:multidrug effflux MFS transporter [Marinibaculum pumilum]|uniref:Bcr/CflA family efflux transporter n=1 Tax=Marinibaculum pumilum TaxID=1766165 RepID=A0ABV7KZH2_9PROT
MTSPAGPASQAGLLALVSSFTATGIIATSIYVPSLPAIAQDLAASPAAVKLTLSVFLATFAVGQLVYGPISDRIGRRPTLISGLAICVLASIGCIFAPDIWSLVGARIVQGLGACVGVVVTRAVIRDLYGRSAAARAMSMLAMVIIMAPVLAPIVGGYIEDYAGWRYQFVFIAAMAALVLALAWFQLPETHTGRAGGPGMLRSALHAYGRLGRNGEFLAYALYIGFAFGGVYCFIGAAPTVFINVMEIPARTFGWIAAGQAMGFFAGSLLSSRLTQRIGLERMVDIGVVTAILAAALLLGLSLADILTVAAIMGPMFLWSMGMGLSFPNAMAGALSVDPRIAGSASALSGFFQMAGGALGAILIGLPAHDHSAPMATGLAVATALAALMWFGLRGRTARAAAQRRAEAERRET